MTNRKYYSIEMYYGVVDGDNYVKTPLTNTILGIDEKYPNFDSYLESISIDSYKPVDLYDFTGEPRRAKIKLFLHNNETALAFFENLILSDDYRLEDTTPSEEKTTNFNVITPFVDQGLGENIVKFPAWYKDIPPYFTQPPIISEDEDITGDYLLYDDIYIRKNSKFLNIYIEVFYHEIGDTNTTSNRVFVGMIEATTLKISPTKTDVEFEAVDGLGILYDALEAYSDFCTFCQDETFNNSLQKYLPNKETGITMQDFITYVFPHLTENPYKTLFGLYLWGNTSIPIFNLATDFTYHRTQMIADYGALYSYSYADMTYMWWNGEWLYIVYIGKFRLLTGGTYYYFAVGITYRIIRTDNGAISFSGGGDININEYFVDNQLPNQEEFWFSGISSRVNLLFPEVEIDTNNKVSIPADSINAIAIQIQEVLFMVYTPVPSDYPPNIIRTISLSSEIFSSVGNGLYQKCISFNTTMSPLDTLRLACLTTTQFIEARGYLIKFRQLDLVNIDNDRWVGWSKIVKKSFNLFLESNDLEEFDEIESVTLWENIDGDNGKNLKPELKEKFRYLMNTDNRISFDYYGNPIYWGEFIKIVDHPNQSLYELKTFFVYESEIKKDITKVKAFWIRSEAIRRR